ncbi:MAG: response regulator, partial [Deltaproteobacteria bacterium]|nr:response regulator [Deltaproteobacteria bacterium]
SSGAHDRILLVDDEEVMRRLFTRAMGGQGYWCSAAASAEEAIELLAFQKFDLALVDKNLPDLSGLEVARRALEQEHQVPVIIVTGYPSNESKDEARSIGVSRYITKPVGVYRLRQEVDNVLTAVKQSRSSGGPVANVPPADRPTTPPPPPKSWMRTTGIPGRIPAGQRDGNDISILILERDNFLRNDLARTLTGEGCRVVAFRSLKQAEVHARYVGYDILIARPEVLQEVKHWATIVPGEPPLGMMAIVNGPGVQAHVNAIQAGARGILSPPFDELAVAAELHEALSVMRDERERFSLPPVN